MLIGETCQFIFRSNIDLSILHKQIEEIWPENGFDIAAEPGLPDWTSLYLVTYYHMDAPKVIDDLVLIGDLVRLSARDPIYFLTDSNYRSSFDDIKAPDANDIIIFPADLRVHYPGSDVLGERYRFAGCIPQQEQKLLYSII